MNRISIKVDVVKILGNDLVDLDRAYITKNSCVSLKIGDEMVHKLIKGKSKVKTSDIIKGNDVIDSYNDKII